MPGFKQSEVGVIPEQWQILSIAQATSKIIDYRGRTPRKLGMDWGDGDIPALSARNVKMGHIDFAEEYYLGSEALYKRWMTNGDAEKDDIVFTTEAPLGNVALIPDHRKYILSQRTILLKPAPELTFGPYLFQLFVSTWFQRLLLENASGSTAQGIQRTRFEKLRIPCPSVPEQRAIAAALGDVDALLNGLDRLIAKKRDLKQAAMQQLLTAQTRLPGFLDEWRDFDLGDVAAIRNAKVVATSLPPETHCVELESIGQGDGRLFGSTQGSGSSTKYRFKKGDVLFGRLRAYLRKYWFASFDGVCSTEIWPLIPHDQRLCPAYLYLLVQTSEFMDAAAVSYGTHMPRSDWSVLKKLAVKLPPPPEQSAIATILSDMDAELTAIESRRDKTRALKQAMMQELLTGRTRLV